MNGRQRTSAAFAIAATLLVALAPSTAWGACVNKFVAQTQGNKRVVTLLTGTLTFNEATEMAKGIADRRVAPVEWLDDKGKPIATSSAFAAVRPMPVACGEKASGAVISVTFVTFATPSKTMILKFPDLPAVTFEEQSK